MTMVNVVPARGAESGWTIEGPDIGEPETSYETQSDAIQAARALLEKHGGGELVIHGEDGAIREKDTIGGNDPREVAG